MERQLQQVDTRASEIEALGKLPPNLALMKMENDQIMAMATTRPRDMAKIRDAVIEQLEMSRTFAESAVYCKPVGKDPQTGEMKYARGLSVRSAECLAEAYGFNRVRTEVTPQGDTARVEATFVDFANGRMWQATSVVSMTATRKGGGTYTINPDRFYGVVCKAEASRCVREVVMRCVPPGLRGELQAAADRIAVSFLTDDAIRKLVEAFATKNVTVDMLVTRFGKRLENFTAKDRVTLAGIWTSLEDGESTVDEHFGDLVETPDETRARMTSPPPGAGPKAVSAEAQKQVAALKAAEEGRVPDAPPSESAVLPTPQADAPRQSTPEPTPAPPAAPAPTTVAVPKELREQHLGIKQAIGAYYNGMSRIMGNRVLRLDGIDDLTALSACTDLPTLTAIRDRFLRIAKGEESPPSSKSKARKPTQPKPGEFKIGPPLPLIEGYKGGPVPDDAVKMVNCGTSFPTAAEAQAELQDVAKLTAIIGQLRTEVSALFSRVGTAKALPIFEIFGMRPLDLLTCADVAKLRNLKAALAAEST